MVQNNATILRAPLPEAQCCSAWMLIGHGTVEQLSALLDATDGVEVLQFKVWTFRFRNDMCMGPFQLPLAV